MTFLTEPSLIVAFIEVALGIAFLWRAADEFVEGAANVAGLCRVSPVLVGAVVVGFGTSAPELLVSALAAANGDVSIGLGNIIGSNVANLTLVLGAASLIVPVLITSSVLRREAPLSAAAVALFAYFTLNGFERWEGIVLLVALGGVLTWLIVAGVVGVEELSVVEEGVNLKGQLFRTLIGLVGTVAGAQLLVWGSQSIAHEFGVSDGFVGFTLVAIGTSLPELATAIVAARKGETGLILGNLLGSNMFNSLAVGGVLAILAPGRLLDESLTGAGVVVMVLVAVGAWFIMITRTRVGKLEGVILFAVWLTAVVLLGQGSPVGST